MRNAGRHYLATPVVPTTPAAAPPAMLAKQPDDNSITAVSSAANATAFHVLIVLFIGVPFLLVVTHHAFKVGNTDVY
jgi:hypothetical protein